jgi:hypothetical protein
MSLENFKPEDAFAAVAKEIALIVSCQLDVRIFGTPGAYKHITFVRVTDHNNGVPIAAQRAEHTATMQKSINGFSGSLADMIRSCRFEVEAIRKKCDAQMEFPFPKGGPTT